MLAARIHDWKRPPLLEQIPDPEPGPGEALVRVQAAALGHIDLTVASGEFAFRPRLPYVPGTDGAGEVLASERFAPGTRVRVRGGGVGLKRDGTWAALVTAPDDALEPLPEGTPPALAACFYSPATTAHLAVHVVGGLQAGERVGVTGAAGAVGSLAVQLAQKTGAAAVFAAVRSAAKADRVSPGATVVVGRDRAALDGLSVDLWIDTVGGPGLPRLVASTRPGGRIVMVGYTAGTRVSVDLPALLHADVRLLPVNLMRHAARSADASRRLLEQLRDGELHLQIEEHPLRELPGALDRLRSGAALGRVVVIPNPPEPPVSHRDRPGMQGLRGPGA